MLYTIMSSKLTLLFGSLMSLMVGSTACHARPFLSSPTTATTRTFPLFGWRGGSTTPPSEPDAVSSLSDPLVALELSEGNDDEDEEEEPIPEAPSVLPDPLVQAAPLVLAATCQDGSVALVAVHSQGNWERDFWEEPLLYNDEMSLHMKDDNDGDDSKDENVTMLSNSTQTGESSVVNATTTRSDDSRSVLANATNTGRLVDLPLDFGGPYRIVSLALSSSIVLLTTGWRADCHVLMERAQQYLQSQQRQLGHSPKNALGLADDLSLYLARRVASDGIRPLSCAALVISTSPQNEATNASPGSIWLTDTTGAYPVRALALGKDAASVNAQLVQALPDDKWTTGMEGLQTLLTILVQEALVSPKDGARVELVILSPQGSLRRLRLANVME